MDDKEKKYIKIGCGILLAGLFGIFVLPTLVTMAWSLVSLGIALLSLAAMWFIGPAILEGMAWAGWKLKELIWKSDPVQKIWRDLADFGEEIESMEKDIGDAQGAKHSMSQLYNQQKDMLSPEQRMEWQEQLDDAQTGINYLIEERDNFREDYQKMKLVCQQEEANWKLGKAQEKVVKALVKAGKMSAGSVGTRVSIQEIHDRLSNSRARLQVIKSRKNVTIKDGKVVDVTEKAKPALNYDPSPSLGMNATAPTDVIHVAVKSSVLDDKLSKI